MSDHRCTTWSLAADEPMSGTASTIRHWLLVEHPGPWGRSLLEARLPGDLGERLRALERRTGARVLLIRRGDRSAGTDCFAIDTRRGWLGRASLGAIDEAGDLDPHDPHGFDAVEGPLVVVCTHGRRDPCCAERGRPLAAAAAASHPGLVWESTHVGGDRFAGNLVAFPWGLYFGRVDPEDAAGIVEAAAEPEPRIGRLDRYRGRASHRTVVQAADIELRIHLGLDRVGDLVPTAVAELRRDRAVVTFDVHGTSSVVFLERLAQAPMRLTCHSELPESTARWQVVAIEGG